MRRVNSITSALNTGQIRLDCGDGLFAEVGDTGIRALTPIAPYLSGDVRMVRRGTQVDLWVAAMKFAEGTSGTVNLTGLVPVGFRPQGMVVGKSVSFWASDTEEDLRVTNSGTFTIQSVVAATNVSTYLSWSTADPWPTTLPGVAL